MMELTYEVGTGTARETSRKLRDKIWGLLAENPDQSGFSGMASLMRSESAIYTNEFSIPGKPVFEVEPKVEGKLGLKLDVIFSSTNCPREFPKGIEAFCRWLQDEIESWEAQEEERIAELPVPFAINCSLKVLV